MGLLSIPSVYGALHEAKMGSSLISAGAVIAGDQHAPGS